MEEFNGHRQRGRALLVVVAAFQFGSMREIAEGTTSRAEQFADHVSHFTDDGPVRVIHPDELHDWIFDLVVDAHTWSVTAPWSVTATMANRGVATSSSAQDPHVNPSEGAAWEVDWPKP